MHLFCRALFGKGAEMERTENKREGRKTEN
jgi:hypothetical protein